MTCAQILSSLRSESSEKTATLYARHGAGNTTLGATFASIEKLRRQIKRDHALACELWQTGYFEARYLAAQIADPAQFTSLQLDEWLSSLESHTLVDCFVSCVVVKSVHAEAKLREWIASPREYTARAAWQIVTQQAMHQADIPDFYFQNFLKAIEKHIHKAPSRTRQAMNQALIAIGSRSEFLTQYALRVATRIGRVQVDHGETDCSTPDAYTYIQKTLARKRLAHQKLAGKKAVREFRATPQPRLKRAVSN